ncbi:unnamed protein product [Owenia fusiformis]|uniref:Uncharacterized protein n=1 Tax=Owenia fusiformis TaxID=6347 RepID=A0A8J1USA3_OWEFU|nr:unnamed protein product [Owenia fusiformis]
MYAPSPSHLDTSPNAIKKHIPDNKPKTTVSDSINNDIDGVHHPTGTKDNNECNLHKDQTQGNHEYEHESSKPTENDGVSNEHDDNNIIHKTDSKSINGESNAKDPSVPSNLNEADDLLMDETPEAQNTVAECSASVSNATIDDIGEQSNQQLDSVENDDKMSQPVDKSEQNNEKQSESPVSMKEDDVNKNNPDGSQKENYIYLNIKVDGKLDKSKYFECIPCTYKTPSKHKYDEHMEAHIHRKYVCKFCDKVFIKSSDVQRHEPLHSQHHKSPIKRFHNQHRNTENEDSDNDDHHEMPNMALTQTFKKSVPDNVPISDPHMDTDDAVGNSEAGADNSDSIIENDHNGDSEVNNEIALMRKQYLDSVKRPGDQGDDEMDIDEESINTLHSPQRTGGLWPGPGYTSTPSDGGPSEKGLSPRRSRMGLNHEDPSYRPSSVRNVNSEAIDGVRRSGRTRTLTSSSLMDSSIWASPDDPSLEIKAEPQYPNMPYDNSYIGESQDYYPGPENDWIGGPRKPHQGAWTYNCVRCKYKTNQKVRYDMHMQSHNGNYICPVCDKAMLYLSDFVRHVDTHEKYYYECPYYNDCKYNSTSLNSFEKHLRTIHPDHASECPTCGFKSNSTVRFFKHLETHSLTANEMLGVLCKSTNREVKHVPSLDIPDGPAVPVISSPASAVLTTSAISAPTSPLLIQASAVCQDTGQLSHNVSDISDFSPKIVSVAGSVTSDFSYIQPTNHVPIKHIPFSSPEHGNTSKKCMFVCMYCKHMFVSEQAIRYHVEKEHKTKLVMAPGGSTVQSSIAMNKPRDPGGRFQTMRSMFDAQKPPSEKSYTCVKQVKTTTGQLLQVTVDKFGVPKSTVAFKCLLCNMIFVAKDNLKIHLEECKVKHGIQHGGKGYIATEESQSYSPESALKMSQNILYKEVQIIPKLVKKKQKQEQTDINDGLELTNNTARLETITKNKCIKTGHFKCKYQGDNTVELFANRNAIVMLKNKPEPKNNVVYKINVGGMTKLQGPGKENPKNSVPRTEINQVEKTETVKGSDSNDIEAATTTDNIDKGESIEDENVSLEIPNQHNNEEIKMDVSVDNQIPKDPTENGVMSNQLPTKNENVISEGELGAIQEYEDSKHKEADSQIDENTSESKNKNDRLLTMLGLIHKNKTQEKNDINESLPSTSSFTSISPSESNQTTGDLVDAMVTSADVMVTSSTSPANSTKLKMLSTEIPCRMCSYKTRSPECYEAHVLGHKAVKHEHSDAIFQSYSLVNVNNREMYECKLCPYRSKRLDKIEQHLFFHKTKQFMCNICDRAFIKRCDLERHMEVEMRNRMRGQGYVFNGARKTVQLAKRRASGYKRGKYRKHKSTPGSQTIKNESFTGYQPNNIPDHLMNI